ncbi:MAG: helix-turn-helix domain-containing protein, partial [Actinomycetes bacterium]
MSGRACRRCWVDSFGHGRYLFLSLCACRHLSRAVPGPGGTGVRRAYTFRLRPTARQHLALSQCLAAHRELYNAAL